MKRSPEERIMYKHFNYHKYGAKSRGIEFLLSFDDWKNIWIESGHWAEKGRKPYQYCMARNGDRGSYSKDNVRIVLAADNAKAATINGVRNTLPGRQAALSVIKGKTYEEFFNNPSQVKQRKTINSDYMRLNNPNKIIVKCSNCGKVGSKPPMMLWHFSNCRFSKNNSKNPD